MADIEIKDLDQDITISEDELKHVKGGLLPAYPTTFYKTPYSTTSYKINTSIDSIALKI